MPYSGLSLLATLISFLEMDPVENQEYLADFFRWLSLDHFPKDFSESFASHFWERPSEARCWLHNQFRMWGQGVERKDIYIAPPQRSDWEYNSKFSHMENLDYLVVEK